MEVDVMKRHLETIKKGIETLINKQKDIEKQLGIVSSEEKSCCGGCKLGDKIEDGLIIGKYVKVKLLKKDGTAGKVTKFVKVEGE